MDWLGRLNEVIDYIEEHLTEEIDYEKLSQIACCSVYNFQRMFSYMSNTSLSEYIRKRRMTLAAYELQNSKIRIIDLAVKYGYDTHESFSRTFQKLHGIAPSEARKKGVVLKAYPRISLQISVDGDFEFQYRIEKSFPSKIFGESIEVIYTKEKFYGDLEDFIAKSRENGLHQKLVMAAGYPPEVSADAVLPGLVFYDFQEKGNLRFMIYTECPEAGITPEFEVLTVPEATWAVFRTSYEQNEELAAIRNIWKRLPEWFHQTGYEYLTGKMELLKCFKKNNEYLAEIWIPIVSK